MSMRIGLFCNARNEKHIREWVVHHLLLGFSHVVVFDHLSSPSVEDMFSHGYDKRKLTIVRINQTTFQPSVKIFLMNRAIQIAKDMSFNWFMYLDADEFLVLHHFVNPNKIQTIVQQCSSAMDSIAFNWLMFGSNNLKQDPNDLILNSYLKSELNLNAHTKALVKTSQVEKATNPHYYQLQSGGRYGCLSGTLEPNCIFCHSSLPFYRVPGYVAHFINQSEETFTNRRIHKQKDDGSIPLTSLPENFHDQYNSGNNYQLQKYIPQIKRELKTYGYLF